MMKLSLPDKYTLEAKYVPSFICSVPFFFFFFYYLKGVDPDFWDSFVNLMFAGFGVTTAMFFIMANLCRNFGKLIEEKIFDKGLLFPTTTFLLVTDANLSMECKNKIIDKIKINFEIDLLGLMNGSMPDRRSINEAVRQINRMFFGKSDFLLQRTIQFGLAKNLFAGSIIAIVVLVIGLIASYFINNLTAFNIATILLLIYVVISVISFFSIRFTANHYAKALYDEFLAS